MSETVRCLEDHIFDINRALKPHLQKCESLKEIEANPPFPLTNYDIKLLRTNEQFFIDHYKESLLVTEQTIENETLIKDIDYLVKTETVKKEHIFHIISCYWQLLNAKKYGVDSANPERVPASIKKSIQEAQKYTPFKINEGYLPQSPVGTIKQLVNNLKNLDYAANHIQTIITTIDENRARLPRGDKKKRSKKDIDESMMAVFGRKLESHTFVISYKIL